MKHFNKITLCLLFVVSMVYGCRRDPIDGPDPQHPTSSHTFVMYAVADNNLFRYLRGNITMAKAAVAQGIPEGCRVLVYYDGNIDYDGNHLTCLTEIVRNGDTAEEVILRQYDDHNSADPAIMKMVLNDAMIMAPADTFGVAFLGHGTGWFPPSLNNLQQPASLSLPSDPASEHRLFKDEDALTRAYGPDLTTYMSPADIVEGLSGTTPDYVIFDVCFMSSVELLYDLRNSTDYIVASPAEVMGDGIPYHRILPELFNTSASLEQKLAHCVEAIYNYYTVQNYPSASFAVVRTSALPALADAVRNVFASGVSEPDLGDIQYLEGLQPNHAFFDLQDYLWNISRSESAYEHFRQTLTDVIVYEQHTPQIYSAFGSWAGGFFDAERVCGISSYIPRDYLPVTQEAYYATDWAKYTQL